MKLDLEGNMKMTYISTFLKSSIGSSLPFCNYSLFFFLFLFHFLNENKLF